MPTPQSQTQQSALVAYQKLFALVSETNPRSITITDAPSSLYTKSLSFLSHQPITTGASGDIPMTDMMDQHTTSDGIIWQKFIIIYPGTYTTTINGSQRQIKVLYYKEIPFNPSVSSTFAKSMVYRILPDRVQSYINNTSYPARVLAVDIDDVDFSLPRYPAVLIDMQSSRYTGIQRVRKATDLSRPQDYTYVEGERYMFSIFPRN